MEDLSKAADLTCPFCGSTRVRRSHRRALVERIFLPFLRRRAFRCVDCYKRFYRHREPAGGRPPRPPVMTDRPTLKPVQDQPRMEIKIPVNSSQVERRGFSRLPCRIPARIAVGSGSRTTGVLSDICLNGCFIETQDTVPVGSEIELSLEVGEGTQSRALVRRSLEARGMGIEFTFMTLPNFRRLQSIARNSVRLRVTP
jgi:PilZ domain